MNRLIYSCLLSCFFWAVSQTSILANSTDPANRVENVGINSEDCDDHFDEMMNDISLKETYPRNEAQASFDGLLADNTTLKNKFSQIKVAPSSGSYLGACEDDEYYIKISGAAFGDGMDISSVTICGVEVCQILMQSSNLVVVYPNSGTPGTGDIVITSKSMGKTTIENAFTYNVPAPDKQARNIQYSNVGDKSGDINWSRGNGESCVVFLKQTDTGFVTPADQTTYSASNIFGNGTQIGSTGWYCVYNGIGTSVKVGGLTSGAAYTAQVFEYNGPAAFETYLISPAADNPKNQETVSSSIRTDLKSFNNASVNLDSQIQAVER